MKGSSVYTFLKTHWEFVLVSVIFTLLILISLDHIFFWDTVQLGSKHASFYFENELKLQLLPDNIDSGHIPTFGYLLAVLWSIFGKSLWISHLFILPFAVGIAWQLSRLTTRFFEDKYKIWVMLIVLLDTTLLSQITLVSPDIPLLFFFLLGLNAILAQKQVLKSVAFACLFLISLRGMILTVPLFLFDAFIVLGSYQSLKTKFIALIKTGLPYIPAALIFVVFSWFHYSQKGWIGYHEDSPWAPFFEKVGVQGALKNTAIFGWRLIDFGRISIWILGFFLGVFLLKNRVKVEKKGKQLLLLTLLILVFLSVPAIIYVDLKGHRYFMPIYMVISVCVCYLLFQVQPKEQAKFGVAILILISIMSGSFWVYPDKVAQGWDSTLGHLPYYQLRQNMIDFMDENNINKSTVGFDFPGAYPQKYLNLSEEEWMFPEVDFSSQRYILYSNVVNDFTDSEIEILNQRATKLHSEASPTVYFVLYQLDE